ncbi:hypothetical protein WMF20_28670 [Sorangium sp. So ce834]|uniref:hypothetical protein n=1 Tax=Sorangium sp. So ce834 TaxID=3133321 RepID=UPI003F5F50DE
MVPPGQIFSQTSCGGGGLVLFVEIWPDAVSACTPSPRLNPEDVLVVGIGGWDGQPGTFTVGVETPQGTARAMIGIDEVEGTITVEPFVGTPSGLSWDLSVGSGSTDLATCGHFEVTSCVPAG